MGVVTMINHDGLEVLLQTGGELGDSVFTNNFKIGVSDKWRGIFKQPRHKVENINLFDLMAESVAHAISPFDDIAIFLSGGVDSTSLLWFVTQELGLKVTAYHTDFGVASHSERGDAKKAAKECNTELKIIDVSTKSLIPTTLEAFRSTRTVDYTIPAVCRAMQRVKANGHDVVLNGLGLDEYLAGYPIHKRLFKRDEQYRPHFVPPFKTSNKAVRYGMRLFGNDRAFFTANMFTAPGKAMVENRPLWEDCANDLYEFHKCRNLWDTVQNWTISHMFNNYATNITRAARTADMKVVFPYIDYDLAEYCLNIHPHDKYNKKPLREMMGEYMRLPESLSLRGAEWDKFGWGGSPVPYINHAEYIIPLMKKHQHPKGIVKDWVMKQYVDSMFENKNRVGLQVMILLKIMGMLT